MTILTIPAPWSHIIVVALVLAIMLTASYIAGVLDERRAWTRRRRR